MAANVYSFAMAGHRITKLQIPTKDEYRTKC